MTRVLNQAPPACSEPAPLTPAMVGPSPTVSFITPAYNAAATLDDTVRSVLAQTIPAWEMLIVDDGSHDDTRDKAKAWARKDPRIMVLSKENGGPAAARNLGLAQARGEWLCFLDADDWLAPRFLEDLLAAAPGADVLVAGHDRVGPEGEPMSVAAAPTLPDPFATLARRCPIVPVAALVRTSVARRMGGFDSEVFSSEDWLFWMRAARLGARFRSVAASRSFYRMLPGSLSRKTERYAGDGLRVIEEAFSGVDAAGDAAEACDAKAGYLMYAAILAACGGGDPAAVFALAPPLEEWSFDPTPWGGVIADLAAYARTQSRSDLAVNWRDVEPDLERFYTALAAVMRDDRHIARLRLHVRAHVLGAAGLRDAPEVAGARLVALDLAAPSFETPLAEAASAETLIVLAQARGRVLGVFEAPAAVVADPHGLRTALRDVAARAALKPALAGLADFRLIGPALLSAAEIGVWARARSARRAAWTIAMRTLARRLTHAPLAVGAPPLALLLMRDREMPANGLAPRISALAARGVQIVAGADAAAAARAGRAPARVQAVIAMDGLVLGGGHPAFMTAPAATTVFAPAGEAGRALRAEASRRGLRLGVRCVPEEAIARRSFADAVAWFAAARAEIDDPEPGVLFAPGDVDARVRCAARQAGFAYAVNPEADLATFDQDPMTWRRLDMRARDPAATLANAVGGAA